MNYAIIVAAGKGLRTSCSLPKQFALLNGLPVVLHSVLAFHRQMKEVEIIIVLNQEHRGYWDEILRHHVVPRHTVVDGGQERFDSVKNALATIPHLEDSLVAIHDAARPLITGEMIFNLFEAAKDKGAAVPGRMPADSVRFGTLSNNGIIDRKSIFLIQTPQVFRGEILKNAYQEKYLPDFTDDASVVEKSGVPIHIIEGDKENFKITFPGDHQLAESILRRRTENTESNFFSSERPRDKE
jgi:2-C-methyl-D-erythritol 4-phosphate cytidylyltransferase